MALPLHAMLKPVKAYDHELRSPLPLWALVDVLLLPVLLAGGLQIPMNDCVLVCMLHSCARLDE